MYLTWKRSTSQCAFNKSCIQCSRTVCKLLPKTFSPEQLAIRTTRVTNFLHWVLSTKIQTRNGLVSLLLGQNLVPAVLGFLWFFGLLTIKLRKTSDWCLIPIPWLPNSVVRFYFFSLNFCMDIDSYHLHLPLRSINTSIPLLDYFQLPEYNMVLQTLYPIFCQLRKPF